MSDITHSRRATEFIEYHDAADGRLPGEDLIKASIHASLANARALREIDTTTRQVHRLTADSIDDLARDLVGLLRPAPILVKLEDAWVNPRHVISVFPRGESAAVSLTSGLVMTVQRDVDLVAATLLGAVS
jgi:hypothetical protein